jgi:nucleotide-binding universal stress UspA family protein
MMAEVEVTTPTDPADIRDRPVRPARLPLHIVLVADGSPDSAAAAETIKALSLSPGSEITVLTKSASDSMTGRQLAEAALAQAAALVRQDGLAVTSQAIPDLTARYLLEYAAARRPDLVVDGTEVPAPTLAGRLRDALNPLVEQLPMPVLVARAPFKGLRRILLAYDGSADSDAAVEYLTRLPLPADCAVTVLNVITRVPTIEAVPAGGPKAPRLVRQASVLVVRPEPHAKQLLVARSLVARAVEVLSGAGLETRGRVLWGDAANTILHKAAATGADLLVAGSRGLSGVWSWLLGSVSRRLVRDRRWPVLIVRGEAPGGLQGPSAQSEA